MKKMFLVAIVAAVAVSVSFGAGCSRRDAYKANCITQNCPNAEGEDRQRCERECHNESLSVSCPVSRMDFGGY